MEALTCMSISSVDMPVSNVKGRASSRKWERWLGFFRLKSLVEQDKVLESENI